MTTLRHDERSAPGLFAEYWSALERGDTSGAVRVAVDAHERGVAIHSLLDDLVCAAQAEVGRRWAANEWNIAQEHRATSIGEEVVAALSSRVPRPGGGASRGDVLVTCADGEWHALPSRVLAAELRASGWNVDYLGASVPAAHLAQYLHDAGPDVVALSCMLPIRLLHAREVIEVCRAAGVPVIVGGRGFGTSGEWGLRLGANAWAPSAHEATRALEDLSPFTDPAPPLDQPDDSVAALTSARSAIIDHAMRAMRDSLPDVTAYDDRQLRHTGEDVGYLIDFLAAALLVDDPDLFTGFMVWFAELLEARGVPRRTLAAGARIVGSAVAAGCGERPRAQRVLAEGIAATGG